jgi:hypothetical protein
VLRARSPRPPTTDSRAETETAAAQIELLGLSLLDNTPPVLVPLDCRPRPRKTRYRSRLAPRRLPSLLALAIPAHSAEDRRSPRRFAFGSDDWRKRTRIGEPPRFTANFRSSVSLSRSGVWRGICAVCGVAADPAKSWLTFLQNHREVIAAFDFFTVPTVTFQLLYCFFVIEHGRRRILHFNVTDHPTAEWVVQQPRETFPEAGPYRCHLRSRFDVQRGSGHLPRLG